MDIGNAEEDRVKLIVWLKFVWLLAALFFGFMSAYSVHYSDPQLGVTYAWGLIALAFPSSLLVQLILAVFLVALGPVDFNIFGTLILNIIIVAAGYYQWFVLVPLVKRKMN